MLKMARTLFSQLAEVGYKAKMVSVDHLSDLEQEIKRHYQERSFNEKFYKENLSRFKFSPPDDLPRARSLIVVAVPQPQARVIFTWKGKKLPYMLPPTYVGNAETDRRAENLLARILSPQKHKVVQALIPEKLLAVCSGLGYYGKNNICYVDGMGSFHQPAAFFTDLPCEEDNWRELKLMEKCNSCSACIRNCPTGAITTERILLHAERCITLYNERPEAFPRWIDPKWHNCILGCLRCQSVCPENKAVLGWIEEKGEFSEEEIALVLQEKEFTQLPSSILRKLEQLKLPEYYHNLLSRNLAVLMNKEV